MMHEDLRKRGLARIVLLVAGATLVTGALGAVACSTRDQESVGRNAAPLTTANSPAFILPQPSLPNNDGGALVGADLVTRNTSTALIAPLACRRGCNLRDGGLPQLNVVTAFEVTNRSSQLYRGVWEAQVVNGTVMPPIPLGGDATLPNPPAPSGGNPAIQSWAQRYPSATWGGILAQPHVLSLGVPGVVAVVGICGDNTGRWTDVCYTVSEDAGHSFSHTYFVNPADKGGFALDGGAGGGIRDVAATVAVIGTNDNPRFWPLNGEGDHDIFVSWQAADNRHYLARIIFLPGGTFQPDPANSGPIVSDMRMDPLNADVNIVGPRTASMRSGRRSDRGGMARDSNKPNKVQPGQSPARSE